VIKGHAEMTETPEEFRRRVEEIDAKFYGDADKRGAKFRERAFEYEKLTVDFSHKGFQTLTYLKRWSVGSHPDCHGFFPSGRY
jgi:hypothetical protein